MNDFLFLTFKCIVTYATPQWLIKLTKQLIQQGASVATMDFWTKSWTINEKQINEMTIEDFFVLCKKHRVDYIFLNASQYRICYPILQVIQKEVDVKEIPLLYPKIPLIAHIQDVFLQNQLKKQAQEMEVPFLFLHKKDLINHYTFDDLLIEKTMQYLNEHYPLKKV